MSSRTRKRGRKIASKDDARRRLKEARDDYSSKEYWDKRYKQGVSWEWYCAFEHIRPLFDRFIPEVGLKLASAQDYLIHVHVRF